MMGFAEVRVESVTNPKRGRDMAWIKTVGPEDGDERLRAAMDAQRSFYPAEYAEPVGALDAELPGDRRLALADPRGACTTPSRRSGR